MWYSAIILKFVVGVKNENRAKTDYSTSLALHSTPVNAFS
jgi:hypothetical protein